MSETESGAARTAREIEKFDAAAADWWDPMGSMRPLHEMQPVRLDYARRQFFAAGVGDPTAAVGRETAPFRNARILDLGCGAGLASEPFARLGARVTGLDLSARALEAARAHAAAGGLDIDYRQGDVAGLAASVAAGDEAPFDACVCFEVVEHLADRAAFLSAAARCLRPGGAITLTTLNRTAKSFATAIVGAEYVLGWLPRGTHDWRKFVRPGELVADLVAAGLRPVDRVGFVYRPLARDWRLSERDLSINYAMTAVKPNG